jgi:hypothetical protein
MYKYPSFPTRLTPKKSMPENKIGAKLVYGSIGCTIRIQRMNLFACQVLLKKTPEEVVIHRIASQ